MPSVLRSVAVFAAVFAVAVMSMPGCSQQGEGERCDSAKNGNDDCDSGLVCVAARDLLDQATDRCCLPNNAVDDARCTRVGSPGSGGSNATGGTTSMDAPGGGGAGGAEESPSDSNGGAGGSPPSSGGTGSDGAGMSSSTPGGAPAAAGAPPSVVAGAGAGGAG
jgi:hypothetical protein